MVGVVDGILGDEDDFFFCWVGVGKGVVECEFFLLRGVDEVFV